MTTSETESAPIPNGHDPSIPHRPFDGGVGASAPSPDRETSAAQDRASIKHLRTALRAARNLPRTLQTGIQSNPAAVLAGVGAASFALGALCGSRVGRILMTTLVGYGVRRMVEGPIAREVTRFAADAMKRAEASP